MTDQINHNFGMIGPHDRQEEPQLQPMIPARSRVLDSLTAPVQGRIPPPRSTAPVVGHAAIDDGDLSDVDQGLVNEIEDMIRPGGGLQVMQPAVGG